MRVLRYKTCIENTIYKLCAIEKVSAVKVGDRDFRLKISIDGMMREIMNFIDLSEFNGLGDSDIERLVHSVIKSNVTEDDCKKYKVLNDLYRAMYNNVLDIKSPVSDISFVKIERWGIDGFELYLEIGQLPAYTLVDLSKLDYRYVSKPQILHILDMIDAKENGVRPDEIYTLVNDIKTNTTKEFLDSLKFRVSSVATVNDKTIEQNMKESNKFNTNRMNIF